MKKLIGGIFLGCAAWLSGCEQTAEEKRQTIISNTIENAALQAELKADSLEREAEVLKAKAKELENEANILRDSAKAM
ncbi:MAG TPA: hypothetical protein VIK89_16615 [Cytophagaceae bacterium]